MRSWPNFVSALFCGALVCAAQTPADDATLPGSGQSGAIADPDPVALPPVRKAPAPETEAKSTPASSGDATLKPYVIGPLDVLYVRVWNNQNLTGMVNVGPDGLMSMALVGELRADGLTVAQLKEAISTRLGDFLNSPEVSVDVTRVNSKKFFVFGGVNHAGSFPLSGKTTISEALSGAGGFSGFANIKKIYVLRGTQKLPFNYKEVIAGKRLEQDIELENGDKIVVPE